MGEKGAGESLVAVSDDFDKLREVPAVPLLNPHRKGVDILVQGVEQRNTLDGPWPQSATGMRAEQERKKLTKERIENGAAPG